MPKKAPSIQTAIEEKERLLIDLMERINAPSLQPITQSINAVTKKLNALVEDIAQLADSIKAPIELSISKSKKEMEKSMDALKDTLDSRVPEHGLQQLSEQQRDFKTMLDAYQEAMRTVCAASRAATIAKLQAGFAKIGATLSTQTLTAGTLTEQLRTFQDVTHAQLTQQQSELEQQLKQCQFWVTCQTIATSLLCIGMTAYVVWQQWPT